jgi:hypothetical protein
MNFNVFSDEFLKKWLTKEDLIQYTTMNDKKLSAGINWLSAINTSSFKRYDLLWKSLKEGCVNCMNKNCYEDYQWIIENAEKVDNINNINSSDNIGFKRIKFPNKEIGKEGVERVKKYHSCKKKCYEKVNLMNSILARKYSQFTYDFSVCLVLCRGKPIDKDTHLSDCYSDCMIKHSYLLPQIEYYMMMMHEQMMKEYNENILELPKADLLHSYRFREREFTSDMFRKYI